MEPIVKQFTLIDFLGIFAPGAVMTLAVHFYVWDLTLPFQKFFGENAVMLAVYFIVLSYLCGSLLHQLGATVENWLSRQFGERNLHQEYLVRSEVQAAYEKHFHRIFPADITGQVKAGKDIYHYVQKRERPQRILIFSAFYTMGRSMAVTLLGVMLITGIANWKELQKVWLLLLCYAIAILLFILRWKRFEKKVRG